MTAKPQSLPWRIPSNDRRDGPYLRLPHQLPPCATPGPSDEGICLLDDDFEPYRTELVEQEDYECCLPLIQERKFDGNRDACDAFIRVSPDQIIEIDEETPFGKALGEAARRGPITLEVVERLLMEERLRTVDVSTVPVDGPRARLRSGDAPIRRDGLFALCSLASQENAAALDAVGEFLRSRPTPLGIDDVRDMAFALRHVPGVPDGKRLVPCGKDQLRYAPSNDTPVDLGHSGFLAGRAAPDVPRIEGGDAR